MSQARPSSNGLPGASSTIVAADSDALPRNSADSNALVRPTANSNALVRKSPDGSALVRRTMDSMALVRDSQSCTPQQVALLVGGLLHALSQAQAAAVSAVIDVAAKSSAGQDGGLKKERRIHQTAPVLMV